MRTATISDLERLEVGRIDTLVKVAKALDVHILDLFTDDRPEGDPKMRDLLERMHLLDERGILGLDALLPKKEPSE